MQAAIIVLVMLVCFLLLYWLRDDGVDPSNQHPEYREDTNTARPSDQPKKQRRARISPSKDKPAEAEKPVEE